MIKETKSFLFLFRNENQGICKNFVPIKDILNWETLKNEIAESFCCLQQFPFKCSGPKTTPSLLSC